jgi:intracellular septation protein
MKLFFDFFPILLFFVAYKLKGIYVATAVAIAVSAIQVGWQRVKHGKADTMALVTLGLLAVFGGLTIALQNPIFVMWKPTLLNWLFAAAFLGSHWIGERTLVERMMSHAIDAPHAVWTRLNLAWVLFFLLSGLANLVVVYWASGFYQARAALIAATGQEAIDLSTCATQFSGDLLALCTEAKAREEIWVDFKLFGMMGLTALFVIGQGFYLARHIKEDQPRTAESD